MAKPVATHPLPAWTTFLAWYFALRPLFIVLLHSQLVLPTRWYPAALLALHRWYVGWSGDPLLTVPPPWFQGVVVAMLAGQLPFELAALSGLYHGTHKWELGLPLYIAHTATTMVPVLADLLGAQHPSMHLLKTLLPKLADLAALALLAAYARQRGLLWPVLPASPVRPAPKTA